MTALRTLTGRCLCGQVEYAVPDAFEYALNCHCSLCRRATGSAFKPFGGIARAQVRITRGDDQLTLFGSPPAHDVHCRHCGSMLYSVVRDGQYAHVTYGTLDQAPTLLPTAHIFVGSKASWYEIRDELPQTHEL